MVGQQNTEEVSHQGPPPGSRQPVVKGDQTPSVLEMSKRESRERDYLPVIVLCIVLLLLIVLAALFLSSLDFEKLLAPFRRASEYFEELREAFRELKRMLRFI